MLLVSRPGAGQQPRRQGVRVPHLTGGQLISTPGVGGKLRYQLQHPASLIGMVSHPHGATDGGSHVRDGAPAPAADLVTEQPRTSQESGADRSLRHHPSVAACRPHRRHLDGSGHVVEVDLERRVEEVAAGASGDGRGQRLVQSAAPPHRRRRPPRTQRNPVEVDSGPHGRLMPAWAGARTEQSVRPMRAPPSSRVPSATLLLTNPRVRAARSASADLPLGAQRNELSSLPLGPPAPSWRWPSTDSSPSPTQAGLPTHPTPEPSGRAGRSGASETVDPH